MKEKHPAALTAPVQRVFKGAIFGLAVLVVLLYLFPTSALSQTTTGSISGVVRDTTGAVVPGATVRLTNESTMVTHTMKSNSSGAFVFTALMPGTYTVDVSSTGFSAWQQKGIVLHSNESVGVPNIILNVGATKQQVTVEAAPVAMVPLTTGASSTTLNNRMVSQLSVQGRDAAELIKLMPGMAINSGLNNTEWNSALTQINNGPIGAFSGSGTAPNGGLQMVMNGSVITDAGNQGTQIANINQDMTQEVTIRNSSFDAEYAHGPVTFQATGKSGTSQYHGTGYVYTRNGSLNSNNSFFNASGISKPIDHYWYPGFNIGGPIRLPFTNFNKNHDKAFFFFGFEHMKQEPVGTLHKYMIPTPAMMSGDFTQSALNNYTGFAGAVPCADAGAWNYGNFCSNAIDNGQVTLYQTNGATWDPAAWDSAVTAEKNAEAAGCGKTGNPPCPGYPTASGAMINSGIDPNGLALMKMLASAPGLTHLTPSPGNPYNAEFLDNHPVTSDNLNIRGDVNITQNMRAFVSFTRQPETDLNNIGVWWWSPASLPYPSPMPAAQLSKTWSIGATNTLSPSLVNEATFGYAYFINPISLTDPSAADPSTYGYNVSLPSGFSQSNNIPQVPNIVTWCCGIESGGGGDSASATTGAGFGVPSFGAQWHGNGDFGKDSYTPDFSDNLSWIKGKHTMKFGFFWAGYANVQTENCCGGGTAGSWDFDNYATNTSFNYYSDMLLGHAQGYSTVSNNPTDYVKYHEFDFYAQDSWKIIPKMTLNFGVRFERMGQWYPFGSNPKGLMVWDPSAYDPTSSDPLTGFSWNEMNASVPLSGWATHGFFPDPRVGVAYDLFGNGRTVLRGGFGIYRSQVAYNDVTSNGVLSAPLGTVPFASNCTFNSLSDLSTCSAAAGPARNTTTFGGLMLGDNRAPYTQTWNFVIDQAAPWHSTLEVQYQGNRSRDLLISSNGAGGVAMANINFIPVGGQFQPDPAPTLGLPNCNGFSGSIQPQVTCSYGGDTYFWQGTEDATHIAGGPPGGALPDYRPYDYSSLYEYRHGSYSNYNALMVQWMKQAGRAVFNFNWTWAHALGIRDGNNDNGQGAGASLDGFNLANNYGVLAFNRSQIFNAAYVFDLPGLHHANALFKGVVNGWQLSGDTQFQTGPPLQPLTGGALNASMPAGVSGASVLGTDGIKLVPMLTCDPSKGLSSGQYFNPSCFAAPSISSTGGASTVAANGPLVWPNITGPGFFNSDLGLYKNFKITERQGLQFRITAFNILNHPLPQFNLTNDINLAFSNPGGGNTNANTTGKPTYTVGNRTIELALKYTF